MEPNEPTPYSGVRKSEGRVIVDHAGIYGIRHVDGTTYVGSSKWVLSRWGHHRYLLDQGDHFNPHLQRAWTLYGAETFEFVILEECDEDRLLEREEWWIARYPKVYNVYRVPAQSVRGRTYDEIYGPEHAQGLRENLSKNGGFAQQKGKTYEEIHGEEEAQRLRQLRSVTSSRVRQERPNLVEAWRQQASQPKSQKSIRKGKQTSRNRRKQTLAERIEPSVRSMLEQFVDLDDPNLVDTPKRYAKFLASFQNIGTPDAHVLSPTFPEEHHELVMVRNIAFVSMCAHHLAPVRGVAHVGYIPNGHVVGLSKLVRIVKHYAHRLTLQERVTTQIANAINKVLLPSGVIVIVKAFHGCMTDRGVEARETDTVTSAVRGCFKENDAGCKDEFLELIRR